MNSTDLEIISEFHADLIRQWGVEDPRAIGYSSRSSQFARFDVIASLFECGESMLDVGCGTGDLFGRIRELCNSVDYLGIDQQDEFIRRARMIYRGCNGCIFCTGDAMLDRLPRRDFVVACGTLSYRREDGDSYLDSIAHLFAAAKKLLVFNMLDAARMFPGEVIVGHDPDVIVAHCKTISDSVAVVRGYLPYDFTVVMARGQLSVPRLDRLRRLPSEVTAWRV